MRWDLVRLGMEARRREEFMSRMKRHEESLWGDDSGEVDGDWDRHQPDEEEPVSREEARVWLARCRASLHGGDKSDKLGPSGEKEEERQ